MRQYRVLVVSLALLPLPQAILHGQRWFIATELSQILHSAAGVEADCLFPDHQTGLGMQFGNQLNRATAVVLTGRGFVLSQAATCIDGLRPPTGTFVENDRTDLRATAFGTSDVRLRLRLGPDQVAATLAIGVGAAWHPGRDWPYGVAEVGTPIRIAKDMRLLVNLEYQYLHLTWNEYRRTYEDYRLVATESLGGTSRWSHNVLLSIGIAGLF